MLRALVATDRFYMCMYSITSQYNISHNVHSTSLFSLAKVKRIRTGDYSEWAKCHVIQNGTIQCYVCAVQAAPTLQTHS